MLGKHRGVTCAGPNANLGNSTLSPEASVSCVAISHVRSLSDATRWMDRPVFPGSSPNAVDYGRLSGCQMRAASVEWSGRR
ncbi:hypothetical protein GCM10027398_43140 [Azotobacter salinestris]